MRLFAVGLIVLVTLVPRSATSQNKEKGKEVPKEIILVPESAALTGLGFGVGIGLTLDIHRSNRIVDAAVDPTGKVRITESSDAIAGFIFESLYFFPFADELPGFPKGIPGMGTGPFAAVEVGSTSGGGNGVINAYAIGWMVGLRQWAWVDNPQSGPYRSFAGNKSWNFGVGLRVDPKAKTLGDGIIANQPLPKGETSIRTKTAPRYGVMFVSSFGF